MLELRKLISSALVSSCTFSVISSCVVSAEDSEASKEVSMTSAVKSDAKAKDESSKGDNKLEQMEADIELLKTMLQGVALPNSSSSLEKDSALNPSYSSLAKQATDLAYYQLMTEQIKKLTRKDKTSYEKWKDEIRDIGKDVKFFASGAVALLCTGFLAWRFAPEDLKEYPRAVLGYYVNEYNIKKLELAKKEAELELLKMQISERLALFDALKKKRQLSSEFQTSWPSVAKFVAYFDDMKDAADYFYKTWSTLLFGKPEGKE